MVEVLLAAAIVLVDQLVKVKTAALVAASGDRVLIPGLLGITCAYNTGASWSILAGKTAFLLIVTALVCAAIFLTLMLERPKSLLSRLCLGMVLGGAVGNALDRLTDGYVTDMFETLFVRFPIFNVADCFIVVGGILFCISILLEEGKKPGKAKDHAPGTDGEC